MTDDAQDQLDSPLYQSLTRNGKTVKVGVYKDGKGGWILEVVDEYWNSTILDDSFQSKEEALAEAMRTIDEDGIDSLIGEPPESPASSLEPDPSQAMGPLADGEIDELDRFLMSDDTSDETMMLDTLDGYLTAIVSGPVTLRPSQ